MHFSWKNSGNERVKVQENHYKFATNKTALKISSSEVSFLSSFSRSFELSSYSINCLNVSNKAIGLSERTQRDLLKVPSVSSPFILHPILYFLSQGSTFAITGWKVGLGELSNAIMILFGRSSD